MRRSVVEQDDKVGVISAVNRLAKGRDGGDWLRQLWWVPILALALSSDSLSLGQVYDLASTVIAQKLAQIPGVGEVQVGGSSLPAVRVSLDPNALNQQNHKSGLL